MLPILFSDTGATSQDGSHSAIFRMQGPEGCALGAFVALQVDGNHIDINSGELLPNI